MVEPGRQIFPAVARESFEAWEVAAVPLPLWLPVEGRRARAWLVVCLDVEEDQTVASEPGEESEIPRMLEQVLARASRKWRARPSRVRVADVELARIVEGLLGGQEVPVEVGRLLVLTDYTNELVAGLVPPDPRPGPLTGAGVTVERLRSFARAAADFQASSCWRYLTDEDLIQVEAPDVEETFRWFFVHRRASRLEGLWFISTPEMFETLMRTDLEGLLESPSGFWTLGFDLPWSAPPEDVDLWERHGLPWAGEDRCPVACFLESGTVERPDARQLAFLEGLLAALAATGEQDLDTGRWEKEVQTADGPMRFILSLPGVFEPLEPEPYDEDFPPPETPQEKAEELLDTAYDLARGRRRVILARQALEIWPDCSQAYCLLASRAIDPETALDFFEQAMAAAERSAKNRNTDMPVVTFSYMSARLGYTETLLDLGRVEEAVESFREMLRLDPDDDQRVREILVNVLIDLDRDEEAQDLLDRYGGDESALMGFPRALLRFRREGDSVEARRSLKAAVRTNRFVQGLLLRTRKLPSSLGLHSSGTEGEAAIYLVLSRGTWTKTPGALDWLRERTSGVARAKVAAKRKKKRRR